MFIADMKTSGSFSVIFWAIGAITLGEALRLDHGDVSTAAIAFLTVTLTASLAALLLTKSTIGESLAALVMGVGIYLQLANLLQGSNHLSQPLMIVLLIGGAILAVVLGANLLSERFYSWLIIPFILTIHFICGLWIIHASPNPHIDVFVFQRDSVQALLHGQNPYSITFPNIYGSDIWVYGKGLVVNDRLLFGYPYFPFTLFLALPGQLLGDCRYAQLAAMTLSGVFIAYAVPGRMARLAMAIFLFTPKGFSVLDHGWTDPFAVCMLSAVIFCAMRKPGLLPYMLGLFLAVKQYLILAVPAVFLLLPRPFSQVRNWWSWILKTVLAGAAVTIPFLLWDPRAFWHNVVILQTLQPFRKDSLSYFAFWVSRMGVSPPSIALPFVVAICALALGLWRAQRSALGFLATLAPTFLAFFALNKQAFCNYYYFVLGILCCAVAISPTENQKTAQPSSE